MAAGSRRSHYGLWVHGNNDTVGAAAALKLATGLGAQLAVDAAARERAYQLGTRWRRT